MSRQRTMNDSNFTGGTPRCGVLLDIDGVLHVGWEAIPGAAEALAALTARGIPHRFLTNSTTATRQTLATRLRDIGLPVETDHVLTAPLATVDYLRQHFPGARCYLIAKGDVAEEFEAAGIELAPDEDGASADVVV